MFRNHRLICCFTIFLLLSGLETNLADSAEDSETRLVETSSLLKKKWLDLIPDDEPLRVALMHVGKAGGRGLRATLGMDKRGILAHRNQCWLRGRELALKDDTNNQSIALLSLEEAWARAGCYDEIFSHPVSERSLLPLAKPIFYECHTKSWCHEDRFIDDTNAFFFSTRHPILRIVSAFNYGRFLAYQQTKRASGWPKKIYGECFKNIDHMAQTLLDHGLTPLAELPEMNTPPEKIPCTLLAQNFVLGLFPNTKGCRHFYADYEFYFKITRKRPNVPILVARQEHQLEDMHKLDKALGGKGNFTPVSKRHGSDGYEVRTGIETLKGKQLFCCMLWQDIQAYQDILHAAVNLNDMEKVEALYGAFDECRVPHSSQEKSEINQLFQFSWEAWHNEMCAKYYKRGDW